MALAEIDLCDDLDEVTGQLQELTDFLDQPNQRGLKQDVASAIQVLRDKLDEVEEIRQDLLDEQEDDEDDED